MDIEIDLRLVPPRTVLQNPDDFTSFKVVIREASHTKVRADVIEQLAGDRATQADWQQGFKRMLDYAESKGWLDENGVQAHIERR